MSTHSCTRRLMSGQELTLDNTCSMHYVSLVWDYSRGISFQPYNY